jgi:peroxiredoxin Q/BCP
MIKVGDKAPQFCLPDKDGRQICLKDFKGKWLVLYFYPKDNTSGCTLEAMHFTMSLNAFRKMGAEIVGVSPDSMESHCRFADKHKLKVTLLSDTDHKVLESYGVWQKKKLYGREFWGVVRSTFLIDPEGKIGYVWRKVKVAGHVEDVKNRLSQLKRKRSLGML